MSRLLKKFFGGRSAPRATPRRPASRLELERLDERLLLSATSAVTSLDGHQSDLYAIDARTRQVVDFHSVGALMTTHTYLGGPQNVTDVAAGFLSFDSVDKPEVVALTAGRAVWAYVPNAEGGYHWNYLGTGFTAISATDDVFGSVFAINQKGQVLENIPYGDPSSWTPFGTPGVAVTAISASKDQAGNAEVFALGANGHIYLDRFDANFNPKPWVTVDSRKAYKQISANDQNTVYGLGLADGQITKETEFNFWIFGHRIDVWFGSQLPSWRVWPLGWVQRFTQISAGTDMAGRDVVYAVGYYGCQPYVFSAQGQWQRMDGNYAKEICGAAGGWYFDVDRVYSLPHEYNPYAGTYGILDPTHPVPVL
jgi:hypothetical protein